MDNATPAKCSNCGAEIPVRATGGVCARCAAAFLQASQTEIIGETGDDPDRAPAAQTPLPPEQIAPHFPQLEILECLGRGGMGVVYKARQKSLNRFVALKLLAPERVGDAKFAERFAREAQALAALNHPNIVTIHDFGQAGGFYFLLMEFVDGVNLRHLLRARKFTPEEALAIVPPLCDALQFAHERGIVHRDIKPENLLLDKSGRVKVADFGIARMLGVGNGGEGGEATPWNATQAAVGTPGYIAPEQRTDPGRVDSRADIYSLGVVFYEMLTGELPGKPIAAPSRKVQIDVRLDEVVLRALEQKPELRYQQASEVKTCVETIVASTGIHPAGGSTEAPSVKSSWSAGPLSSSDLREIEAHLTKGERREAALIGLLWGAWVVLATFGNMFLIRSFPAPANWIVASVIAALFIASVPTMLRMQRRFLCSTAWAKERGYEADRIKLFSFSPSNLRLVLIYAGVAVLLIFVSTQLVMHLSGVPELTQSLKEEDQRNGQLKQNGVLEQRHAPANIASISFGGQDWLPWRTMFAVKDDKVVTLPRPRPGFDYGHDGGGRGPLLFTTIGNRNWKDYRAEFEFCVTGIDPSFNPYSLPLDYHDGEIWFHVADAKESWNERGASAYILSVHGDGLWFLRGTYNEYCAVPRGFGLRRKDGERELAEGAGLNIDHENGNKYAIEVKGQRIQVWIDGRKIADVIDDRMDETIGGQTLDHGGIGFVWGYDAMGWVRNFSLSKL